MWQSPTLSVKMAGCRTLKETLRSHWERGRLARGLLAALHGCRVFTLCKTAHHQGGDRVTLYNITFSKEINSVTNNNAIYVLGSFYNIKCHPVTRRQIVSCSYQILFEK